MFICSYVARLPSFVFPYTVLINIASTKWLVEEIYQFSFVELPNLPNLSHYY